MVLRKNPAPWPPNVDGIRPRGTATKRARWIPRAISASGGGNKKNHYEILGLESNASPQDIKKAFRQLAHKYHPDVNKRADAEETFKSVRVAYEVLSNENSRRQYNQTLRTKTPESRDYNSFRYARPQSYRYYDPGNYDDEKSPGRRRRRKFEPTWVRRHRAANRNDDVDDPSTSNEAVEEDGQDWLLGWQSSQNLVFVATWTLAVIVHRFGIRAALAALAVAMSFRTKLSAWCKLSLVVTWLIGGGKGILAAYLVLQSSSLWGAACDAAVFTLVLGVWLRGSFLSVYALLPPPVLLFMAIKLVKADLL